MAAVTSAITPRSARSQRWLARLSFVLVGLAIVILAVFAGLKSIAMLAVGLGAAAVGLAAAFFFLSRRGVVAVAGARGCCPCADRRDRRLCVRRPVVGGDGVGCRVAARGHGRALGAGWEPGGLAYARAPGGTICPAPVPDHEPEFGRREGRQ